MLDFFDENMTKQMTESFMAFKGFNITTPDSIKVAIKWLENATGNDVFFSASHTTNPDDDAFDQAVGSMNRESRLHALFRTQYAYQRESFLSRRKSL